MHSIDQNRHFTDDCTTFIWGNSKKKHLKKGVLDFLFTDYEFIAEIMNSLKSLEIGIKVLLIIISLEFMASI